MERKIKNYLHKECVEELIKRMDEEEQLYIQQYGNIVAFAVGVVLEWLETEIQGTEPGKFQNHEGDFVHHCGKCLARLPFIDVKCKFCPMCGMKIDWRRE